MYAEMMMCLDLRHSYAEPTSSCHRHPESYIETPYIPIFLNFFSLSVLEPRLIELELLCSQNAWPYGSCKSRLATHHYQDRGRMS